MRLAVAAIVLALITGVANASPTTERPLDDQAMVIDDTDEAVIENDLRELKTAGVEMAVIVVQRTGTAIESYARDAAASWSTGRSAAAVLVIAIADRKSRIEVSDSLRAKFPDTRAQAILDNARGYLRSADYDAAVRAIIAEVSAAHRGDAPDFESPHPQSGLPPTTPSGGTTTPSRSYDSYSRPPRTSYAWVYVVIGLVVLLGFGALWAAAARKSNFTLSHDGTVNTLQRSFVADWLWHSAKIVGYVGFILFIIAAASGKGSSSTSSSSWGSSSGGGWSGGSSGGGSSGGSSGGGSSGGGWSGGGASSSW